MRKERIYLPESLDRCLEILKSEPCQILAGGTDFMLKKSIDTSKPVIYLGKIKELRYIEEDEERVRIGAMTTLVELEKSKLLKELFPIFDSISSPAIKNFATLGGNICNASIIADTLLFVYGMGGRVILTSENGDREICVGDFIIGSKKISLAEDEILKEINIEHLRDYKFLWKKVSNREANALSKLSVFVAYKIKYGKIIDIRITIGGMGPKVLRSFQMEKYLIEKFFNHREIHSESVNSRLESYLDEYLKFLSPITDHRSTADYKRAVCKNILTRFFLTIYNQL